MDILPQDNTPYKLCSNPDCENPWLPATAEYFYRYRRGDDTLRPTCKKCTHRGIELPPAGMMKLCTGPCGRTLPATKDFFHRNGKYSLYTQCKECRNSKKKAEYRIPEVHERIVARSKAYRDNPENKEQIREANKEWRLRPESREYLRNYTREYRTRPGVLDTKHAWDKEYMGRPEVKAHRLDYEREYLQIPEKRERHRERSRVNAHNRRARINAIPGTYTPEEVQEQLKRQRHRCYYAACGYSKFPRVKENGKWKYIFDVEHTFPVSRVASSDIPANSMSYLVLACESCNSSKNNKFPWEWPQGGRLL